MGPTEQKQEIEHRFAQLADLAERGEICRRRWTGEKNGRRIACLLLSLAPEVEGVADYSESRCPAWLLPAWLAHVTPWIDDAGTDDAWPATVRRFADVVGRAARVFDAAAWHRAEFAFMAAALEVCRGTNPDTVDPVIALCRRVVEGDEPRVDEWDEARALTMRLGFEAYALAKAAANMAACAAMPQFRTDATAARCARHAADAAYAKQYEAADRITSSFFGALEREIAKVAPCH